MDDDEPDPWKPLREKVGEDLEESYLKEMQLFLIGEKLKSMSRLPLSMPYYLQIEEELIWRV